MLVAVGILALAAGLSCPRLGLPSFPGVFRFVQKKTLAVFGPPGYNAPYGAAIRILSRMGTTSPHASFLERPGLCQV